MSKVTACTGGVKCGLDETRSFCKSCGRSIGLIRRWGKLTDFERKEALEDESKLKKQSENNE